MIINCQTILKTKAFSGDRKIIYGFLGIALIGIVLVSRWGYKNIQTKKI